MKDLLLGNCNFTFISTNMLQSKSGFQSLFKMKVRMRIKKKFILIGACLTIAMTTGGCEKMYNDLVLK